MIRWLCAIALLGSVPALAQPANLSGERAFQRCYSCHSVTRGDKGLSGPSLHALDRRAIAADPDFDYSKAFKTFASRNQRWTPELLDRFLTDPEAVVPGNQMGFFGLKDARERTAIIGYILNKK
ncbi:hypothetical protein [Blastomonas sp. AAP53]|uniref:c-type cytochrome n=1 Tax=Blastomonas sp. AAP53 TaxID=1248760 RepID=UPI0003134D7C|nr:hypothetical protein [Blastomonas sp. AAP53]